MSEIIRNVRVDKTFLTGKALNMIKEKGFYFIFFLCGYLMLMLRCG